MEKKPVNFKIGLAYLLLLLVVAYYLSPPWLAKAGLSVERGFAGLEVKSITVGDEDYRYLTGGTGPDMVLVHGFGGDKDNFVRFARSLTKRYHLIIPDLTGYGESTKDMKVLYDVLSQASRFHEFIKFLGLKSFHLAGHSMGGAIVGTYAAQYPEMVKSLLLISPAGVSSAPDSELMMMLKQGMNPFIVSNSSDLDKLLALNFYHMPFIPRPVRLLYASNLAANQDLMKKTVKDLTSVPFSLENEVRQYPGPVLVMWGDQDRILHFKGGEILEKAHPGVVLKIIQNCGHLPMVERPKETAGDYLSFLKNLKGNDE
ncbi:MAG: alpha/beta hydrolase [Desulfobacteraceae bacterium]|nr:MAG: alpha/beta hydrolase [Desulfobacteraceae bacterium]